MLGKLFLPGVVALGFFLYTHTTTSSHVASAYVSQACDATAERGVNAAFAWPPPAPGAEQTWVDVGLDPQFGLGWYQGHGPLPPSQNTFSVAGLVASTKYYYRVMTLAGGKWKTIAKGSFAASCTPAVATAVEEPTVAPPPPLESVAARLLLAAAEARVRELAAGAAPDP